MTLRSLRRNIKGLAILVGFGAVIAMLGRAIGNLTTNDPILGFIVLAVAVIVLGGAVQIILSLRRRY